MAAKTVRFAIPDEERPELDALVAYFANGNRSEFLMAAMKRMKHQMWAEKMCGRQAAVREDLGGRVVPREEVTAMVKKTLRCADA